jgi:hypothetical protein
VKVVGAQRVVASVSYCFACAGYHNYRIYHSFLLCDDWNRFDAWIAPRSETRETETYTHALVKLANCAYSTSLMCRTCAYHCPIRLEPGCSHSAVFVSPGNSFTTKGTLGN